MFLEMLQKPQSKNINEKAIKNPAGSPNLSPKAAVVPTLNS